MMEAVRNIGKKLGLASILLSGIASPAISQEVKREKIGFSQNVVDYIAGNTLEQKLFEQLGKGTEFFLETKDGKIQSVGTRNGQESFRKDVQPDVADAIRRIYTTRENFLPTYTFNDQITENDLDLIQRVNDGIVDTRFKQKDDVVNKALDNLKKAGSNAREFLRAVDLIREKGSEEMRGAAIAYISRMEGMGYRFLEEKDGVKRVITVPDLTTMTASTFYDNLTVAFEARDGIPWGKDIPAADFVEYVLPARITEEPLQPGARRHLYNALAPIARKMKTPEEFLQFANRVWAGSFQFQMTPFEDQSTLGRLHSHTGRCEDCVNAVGDMCKAVGIPAFHLSTPAWAKANDNHTWIGMKKNDNGKEWNFSVNAGFPDPVDPHAYVGCDAGKVYRKSPWGLQEDVTREFVSATDVRLTREELLRLPTDKDKLVALHVINYGLPVAIYGRPVESDGSVSLRQVGNKDMLYFLAFNRSDWRNITQLDQATNPFVLRTDGSRMEITDQHDPASTKMYDLVGDNMQVQIGEGQTYDLAWWNNGQFVNIGPLYSERLENGTYVLPEANLTEGVIYTASRRSNPEQPVNRMAVIETGERPFIVKDGKITRY